MSEPILDPIMTECQRRHNSWTKKWWKKLPVPQQRCNNWVTTECWTNCLESYHQHQPRNRSRSALVKLCPWWVDMRALKSDTDTAAQRYRILFFCFTLHLILASAGVQEQNALHEHTISDTANRTVPWVTYSKSCNVERQCDVSAW